MSAGAPRHYRGWSTGRLTSARPSNYERAAQSMLAVCPRGTAGDVVPRRQLPVRLPAAKERLRRVSPRVLEYLRATSRRFAMLSTSELKAWLAPARYGAVPGIDMCLPDLEVEMGRSQDVTF